MSAEAGTGNPSTIDDGRYAGSNQRYWLELRVDRRDCGMISGDLQYAGTAPPDHTPFAASFQARWNDDGTTAPLEWSGGDAAGTGLLSWTRSPSKATPDVWEVTLKFLTGDTEQQMLRTTVPVARIGTAPRVLGLEIETEDGVNFPPEVLLTEPVGEGRTTISIRECFGQAGIEVRDVGEPSTISAAPNGWTESEIFDELNKRMSEAAQADLGSSAFEVHVLALSRTDRGRLCGLSFDNNALPRQGVAVFVDTINTLTPADRRERKIIETAVHEIGHALNLVHRFDRRVRLSTSPSFMNYEWRYRGGIEPGDQIVQGQGRSNSDRFWRDFKFTFDADELRHLRHAGRSQIVPGGAAFGSVPYWQNADDPSVASPPGEPWNALRLWLTPPKSGTTFAYGQPMFVTVSLANTGNEPAPVPRHLLDIKAGELQLIIQPVGTTIDDAAQVVPIVRRCFESSSAWTPPPSGLGPQEQQRLSSGTVWLGPGESIHANVNLAYSAGGTAADPGDFEITPFLSIPPGPKEFGLDQIVMGTPLRVRIRAPQSGVEERDAHTLFRPDVSASLALGGSTCLQRAAEDLAELRARRLADNRSGAPDPVVAVVTRAAGIEAGRLGRTREAAFLLDQATTPEAIIAFDPHTAEHTRRLADRYRRREVSAKPIPVVVDLWTRPKQGGGASGISDVLRTPGFLVVEEPGTRDQAHLAPPPDKGNGWAVLAPASAFPKDVSSTDTHDAFAEVVVAPGDGFTQRIAVTRIRLGTDHGQDRPAVAVLELANPVPADRRVPADLTRTALGGKAGSFAAFFDRAHPTPASWPTQDELNDSASAVDEPLSELPPLDTATPATVLTIDDVASWWCDITPFCEPVPPATEPQSSPSKKDPKPPKEPGPSQSSAE